MKFILLLLTLTFTAPVFTQISIGMTMNGYFNGGKDYTFDDARTMFPNSIKMDTGTFQNDYTYGSGGMSSSVSIGTVVRWVNPDTSSWANKWSKTFSLTFGNLNINQCVSYKGTYYDQNKPYTVISGNDTTTILTDSTIHNNYYLDATGMYSQLGFHFSRIIPTPSRVLVEVGMGVRAGISQLNYTTKHEFTSNIVADSANPSVELPRTSTESHEILGKRQQFNGQIEVSGGLLFPLQMESDIWWLSLNINIGYGGYFENSRWISRATFVPAIGMNYRIVPKDQRPTHPIDTRRQGS